MKLTAIPRITLGLVSVSIGLLLAFDLLLHIFPSEADTTREARTRQVASIAIQAAALVQARDPRSIDRTLAALQAHDADIESIGLRRADGALVSQAGDHLRRWPEQAADRKSANEMSAGLLADRQRWGQLEVAFKPIHRRPLSAWFFSGPTKLLLLFSVSASLLFFVYLRRMLQHLDPSAAVPERVRGAFDALTEGLLIVDPQEQVLLANRSFMALSPDPAPADLVGKKASGIGWLQPANAEGGADAAPWLSTMKTRQPVHGQPFCIVRDGEVKAHVVLNCSPLLDEQQGVRGCLVTFDDVTALERSHEQLLEVLADLATSKGQLEMKNAELEDLASIDPLSGCLNRRAFYAGLQQRFREAAAKGSELVCIMADIDHFKQINDRHGHGIGDEAIQRFAEILRNSVRQGDLVGRYGGEEFCVVISGMPLDQAKQLAETVRQRLAIDRSVGSAAGLTVPMSASFGLSMLSMGAAGEAQLVDQADQAMYVAKQGGRNRVVVFGSTKVQTRTTPEKEMQ